MFSIGSHRQGQSCFQLDLIIKVMVFSIRFIIERKIPCQNNYLDNLINLDIFSNKINKNGNLISLDILFID